MSGENLSTLILLGSFLVFVFLRYRAVLRRNDAYLRPGLLNRARKRAGNVTEPSALGEGHGLC